MLCHSLYIYLSVLCNRINSFMRFRSLLRFITRFMFLLFVLSLFYCFVRFAFYFVFSEFFVLFCVMFLPAYNVVPSHLRANVRTTALGCEPGCS
jgi:hypothetical protein